MCLCGAVVQNIGPMNQCKQAQFDLQVNWVMMDRVFDSVWGLGQMVPYGVKQG